MKQTLLTSLKKELEQSFGRKITSSRDCIQMVEDIYRKTGETVNANTLRRFFGLVKAEYPPSKSTLTILAKYCGFNSIEEIEHVNSKETSDSDVNREEVLRYMVSLFKNTQISGNEERTFHPIVEQTIVFLERNPALIDRFQREIAKTTSGQHYYYEKMPNIDRLNGYYGDGLRHYLRSKATEEGKVFGHSMQVFRDWLTRDTEHLVYHASQIPRPDVTPAYPPHILGRSIAARLYAADVRGDATDEIMADAKRYHAGIKANREDSQFSFPDFELIICEALLLTGHGEEGSEYIWHGKTFLAESGQDKNSSFDLWEAFAHPGNHARLKEFIDTQELHYSFARKYNTIVKLLTASGAGSSKQSQKEQLNTLIKETGYKRLLSLPVY